MLETAPSLSIYYKNTGEGEEEKEREPNGLADEGVNLVRSVAIGNKIDCTVLGNHDFSFSKPDMDLINEEGDELGEVIGGLEKLGTEEEIAPPSPPMYRADGLGAGVSDNAQDFRVDRETSEEYYREILEEYPNHPLVLRNYANLLQNKGDLQAAEYYYFQATQANPGDGETLSRYAQLLWELYRDQEKSFEYFKRAVQTAPDDSDVLAAYAKFLWEQDDDGVDECIHLNDFKEEVQSSVLSASHPREGILAGEPNDIADIENYCKRMIEENPSDPLFLKTYAYFLYQSKGDLKGAEGYYSKATIANPQDGKVLSQYGQLVWELYHDVDRTASYFEKAIQAAPGDCDVLATYASYLWATDDEEVS